MLYNITEFYKWMYLLNMPHAISSAQSLAPVGSLAAYISWTQSIPVLTREEEADLIDAFFNKGQRDAAKKLILAHLRFVVYVSRGFLGYGLSHEDLIQEGNVGLMKALKRFNPTAGVRLVSFAIYWIKSEIQEFILKNWRIVKLATTKAARTLFFKKQRLKRHMSAEEVSAVSKDLNVPEADVLKMQEKIAYAHDVSFDPHECAQTTNSPEKTYIDETTQAYDNARLKEGLQQLDPRAATIIHSRWLGNSDKETLQTLADRFGVSIQRINQIEKSALNKLKQYLSSVAK